MKGTLTWVRGKLTTPEADMSIPDRIRLAFLEREEGEWTKLKVAETLSRQFRGEILLLQDGIYSSTRAKLNRPLITFKGEGLDFCHSGSVWHPLADGGGEFSFNEYVSLAEALDEAVRLNDDLMLDPLEQLASIPEDE